MTVAEMTRPYTPEELLRLPDSNTLELVDRQIVEKQVSKASSKVEGLIYFRFQAFLLANPVAEVYPASLGYQCFTDDPGKIRRPGVTVVRIERREAPADPDSGYMPIVPDLAVQVVSPNDVVYEVDAKIREYRDAGFPLIWVADPMTRSVVVYPLRGRPAIFTADDELTAESALPGFRCKVADFFPPALPANP